MGDHIFQGIGMGLYRRLYAWAAEGRSKRKPGRNSGWVSIKDHESQQARINTGFHRFTEIGHIFHN